MPVLTIYAEQDGAVPAAEITALAGQLHKSQGIRHLNPYDAALGGSMAHHIRDCLQHDPVGSDFDCRRKRWQRHRHVDNHLKSTHIGRARGVLADG